MIFKGIVSLLFIWPNFSMQARESFTPSGEENKTSANHGEFADQEYTKYNRNWLNTRFWLTEFALKLFSSTPYLTLKE